MVSTVSTAGSTVPGSLFIVATPIGNMDDWTHRGEAVVRAAAIVLCEDTRHTRKLLERYGIRGKRLESYHDFNEAEKTQRIVDRMRGGTSVALLTDAGTPTVSDPGFRLVRACRAEGLPVIPVPGPSAVMAALSVSGLATDEFRFVGFLPSRKQSRQRRLESLRNETATIVLYEAPHRLVATLNDILDLLGNRKVFLGREMTKMHEEYLFGPVRDVLETITERGEAVVVIEGAQPGGDGESIDVRGMSRKEILKLAAQRLGVERKELYAALFRKTSGE